MHLFDDDNGEGMGTGNTPGFIPKKYIYIKKTSLSYTPSAYLNRGEASVTPLIGASHKVLIKKENNIFSFFFPNPLI